MNQPGLSITTLKAETKDFDGSARREFAAELSFRWEAQHRIDAAFEHAALPLRRVRLSNTKAPRMTMKPQDREQ
jgi:hypothetical protein